MPAEPVYALGGRVGGLLAVNVAVETEHSLSVTSDIWKKQQHLHKAEIVNHIRLGVHTG